MSALEPFKPSSGCGAAPWGRLIAVAALAALIGAAYAFGWKQHFSFETLLAHRSVIETFIATHPLTSPLAFVILYAIATAVAIPAGAILAMIGGLLFGMSAGALGAVAGSTAGATALFMVARALSGQQFADNPALVAVARGIRADAFYYIVFLRLVPSPSWFTSAASGCLRVRIPIFVAATALGRVPGSLAFAGFGAGLGGVLEAHEAIYRACLASGESDCRIGIGPATVLSPTLLAVLIGLGLLALLPVLAKRLMQRRIAVAKTASESETL